MRISTVLSLVSFAGLASTGDAFTSNSPSFVGSKRVLQSPKSTTTISTTRLFQPQSVTLQATSVDDDEPLTWKFNPLYGGFTAIFLGYALFLSPGEFFSQADNDVLNAFLADPIAPLGVSKLFVAVFNELGVMPMVMASLMFTQGSKKGLPGAPFALASVFMGYFALFPYLTFRAPPVESKTRSEMAWFSRNVLENKVFNWLVVALVVSVPVTTGVLASGLEDWSGAVAGYLDLFGTTKLASISTVDLCILTTAAAALIPRDYRLRVSSEQEEEQKKANWIAASTVLFPVLGAALYCALRPPLPEE